MCNMISYKSKVIHVEYDILNVSPIRLNRNAWNSKENNCGDEYSMVFLYEDNLCDTIIAGNADFSSNNIMENIYSVLSSLHISGTK